MSQGPKLRLPRSDADGGRAPYVVALLVQIAVIGAISSAVSVPLIYLARYEKTHPMIPEHVTYVTTPEVPAARPPRPAPLPPKPPPVDHPPPTPPAAATPPSTPPAVPPVTPPVTIPLGVSPPASGGADTAHGAARPLGLGIAPGPTDPRLLGWGPLASERGTLKDNRPSTDSTVHAWVKEYWDSVAKVQGSHDPMDWTVSHNGKKYGLDPKYIYFGKYKLPTVLLALLPISAQSNPTVGDRNRQMNLMRQDIMFQAMRAANEDDFNAAVKAIRKRKEAEHQAELLKAAGNKPPPPPPSD